LIERSDIRGDLQVHTEYSDGSGTVREMAEAADERDLEYVLLTDHGPHAPIPETLDRERFDRQRTDIDEVNADDNVDVTVLQGIEAEITADGLEIPEGWCADCDLIVAGLHGRLRDPTDRVIDAFRESPIDMFAHPTNRLRTEREPLDLDLDAVMEAAAAERVAIEINAQPERLDLEWESVKEYRETVRYVVSTDAHTTGELDTMDLGISQARRGWCEVDAVLNTRPLEELQSYFAG